MYDHSLCECTCIYVYMYMVKKVPMYKNMIRYPLIHCDVILLGSSVDNNKYS